jgi:hypothetical protein
MKLPSSSANASNKAARAFGQGLAEAGVILYYLFIYLFLTIFKNNPADFELPAWWEKKNRSPAQQSHCTLAPITDEAVR